MFPAIMLLHESSFMHSKRVDVFSGIVTPLSCLMAKWATWNCKTPTSSFKSLIFCLLLFFSLSTTPNGAAWADHATVKLQLRDFHQFRFAGFYAAEKMGYYKQRGLNVRLLEGHSQINAIEKVLTGKADFGVAGSEVLLHRLKGDPVVVGAVICQHSPTLLLSRKSANIFTPQETVGKRLMLGTMDNHPEIYAMLLKEGVHWDQLQILNYDWQHNSSSFNDIDALAFESLRLPQLKQVSQQFQVISPRTYGIDFYGDTIFTSESLATKHPEMVHKFIQASLQGWNYALENPDAVIDWILQFQTDNPQQLTRPDLQNEAVELNKIILPDLVQVGHMNEGRWQHIADTLAQLNMVPAAQPLNGFVFKAHSLLQDKNSSLVTYGSVVLAVLVLITSCLVLINRRLEAVVKQRTRDLDLINSQLRQEISHRQQSEERLRMIAEFQHDWEYWLGTDGRYHYISPSCQKVTGYAPQEFLDHPQLMHDIIHPDDRDWVVEHLRLENSAVETSGCDFRILCKNGETRWIGHQSLPVFDQEGRWLGRRGSNRNITNRKNAEIALSKILSTSREGFWRIDLEFNTVEVNEAMCEILGYSREELLGVNIFDLVDEENRNVFKQQTQLRAQGISSTYEVALNRKDGSQVFAVLNASPIFGHDGKRIGSFAMVSDITQRQQIERELRHANAFLERVMNSTMLSIFMIDANGTVRVINDHGQCVTGYSRDELIGRAFSDLVAPESLERFQQALEESIRERKAITNLEFFVLRRDRVKRLLRCSWTTFIENEQVMGVVGTAEDITDQKLAEKQLKHKETQFRDLIEAAQAGVCMMDVSGRINYVNPRMGYILGYSNDEMLGQTLEAFLDWPRFNNLEFNPSRLAEKPHQQMELCLRHKNGKPVYINLAVSRVNDIANDTALVIGFFFDVSETKITSEQLQRSQQKLVESERRYSALIDAAQDTVMLQDLSFNYLMVNKAFYLSLGFKPGEIQPSEHFSRIHVDDVALVRRQLQLMKNTGSAEYTYRILHKNGQWMVRTAKSVLIYGDQKEEGILSIIRDVTENKRIEQALQRDKEQAQAASKAKSQFLTNMSHEIRTPLNSMVGFSQILLKQARTINLPLDFQEYLQYIHNSGQNLAELINNILDLSRIESGNAVVNLENVDLKMLVRGIYQINFNQAAKKELEFEYEVDPKLPDVIQLDRTKVNQIMMNLISNAIKFTPNKRKVQLQVLKHHGKIAFKVIDQGVGIPRENQKLIFQAFEHANNSTTRQYKGTGMGLAIVRSLTELLQGEVLVQSDPEVGSVFEVRLPLKQGNSEDVFLKKNQTSKPVRYRTNAQVLMVEDNPMNQQLVREFCAALNLDFHVAENGEAGVEQAITLKPDLIIMDLHMPGMDGWNAIQLIRSQLHLIDTPIVVLSADPNVNPLEDHPSLDIQGFLTKPVDLQVLTGIFNRYLAA